MRKLISLLLFVAMPTMANDAFIGYGVGVFHSAEYSRAETKVINLGYRQHITGPWSLQYKVGYWGDGSGQANRTASGYASVGPIFNINFDPLYLYTGWGIGAISNPDGYLGGRLPQFNGTVGFLVRDKQGAGIGASYEHISSAGFVMPNVGRDFVTLNIVWGM
jgi:hypothetical protein